MSLYSEYNKSVSVDLFKVKKPDAIFPVKSYSVYFIWTNPQKCILTQFSTFKEVVDVPIVVKDYINVVNKKAEHGKKVAQKKIYEAEKKQKREELREKLKKQETARFALEIKKAIELTNENPPLNRFFRMLDSQNTRPIAVSEEAKRGVELCINNEWLAILNAIKGRAPKLLGAYQKEKIKWTPKTVEYALLTGACRFYFSSFEVLFKSPDVTPERLLKYIDVLYKWSEIDPKFGARYVVLEPVGDEVWNVPMPSKCMDDIDEDYWCFLFNCCFKYKRQDLFWAMWNHKVITWANGRRFDIVMKERFNWAMINNVVPDDKWLAKIINEIKKEVVRPDANVENSGHYVFLLVRCKKFLKEDFRLLQLKYLLDAGLDLNRAWVWDKTTCYTPLMAAIDCNDKAFVFEMLKPEYGCDINMPCWTWQNVRNCRPDIYSQKIDKGFTALDIARKISTKNTEAQGIVKELLRIGAKSKLQIPDTIKVYTY